MNRISVPPPRAFQAAAPWSLPDLHRRIARAHRTRLSPGTPDQTDVGQGDVRDLERQFLRSECRYVTARAALAPNDRAGFCRWFEDLARTGPGQDDPLFDFLAKQASLTQMRWFLAQEAAADVAFDELVALTLVRLPREAKGEMARSAFDEISAPYADPNGLTQPVADPPWEALAVSNLMTSFALDRRYALHSVGALGVVLLTTPAQRAMVIAGLTRLEVDASAQRYLGRHPAIDEAHARRWIEHVIDPILAADRRAGRWIAEGALARLNVGKRCFDRYRIELGLSRAEDTTLVRAAG